MNKNWEILLKSFKFHLVLEKSLSENSILAYQRDVRKFMEYLKIQELDFTPADIQYEDLQQFIVWINELGLETSSQARIISGLKAFYNFLVLEEIIVEDPTTLLETPKLKRKIPHVLTYEEINLLFSVIDMSEPHGVRDRAMLETLYACGLRVSELIDLQISNLFLDLGIVRILGKSDKERLVPIGADAIKFIEMYRNHIRVHLPKIHDTDTLFLNRRGRKLTRVWVFMVIKNLAKAANIKKNISPHTFRHSFATHLIEGGADLKAVQDMLGHESITTTEIYTHLDTSYLRKVILDHHPRNLNN